MDRHPQQIKRERQDIKRRARNIDSMSRLYLFSIILDVVILLKPLFLIPFISDIKNVLSTTTKADADKAYGEAVSIIDKAVSKNLIHKNTGSRRKAQITRHVNSLS